MDVFFQTENHDRVKISNVESSAASSITVSTAEAWDECIGFLQLMGKNISLFPEKYLIMKKALMLSEIELLRTIPPETIKEHFQNITETLQNALCCKENEEYLVSYLEIKRFLRELSPPTIDVARLKQIVAKSSHEPTAKRMLELLPDDSGRARKSEYSMHGSRTGRLVIKSGPQILTMPSETRSSFESSYRRGKILQIDLISAEPKIALHMQGKDEIVDVYEHISKVILGGKVSRDQAKLTTLCALYGQSPTNLGRSLPGDISPNYVIKQTKRFFDVYNLEKLLKNSMRNNNLRNALGRPIKLPASDERLLVSYFLQSSAAEISILAFSQWCRDHQESTKPLYVIHDAVIADCDEPLANELLSQKTLSLSVGDWKFESKVTEI